MKKHLLVVAIVLFLVSLIPQRAEAQFGIKAGIYTTNLSEMDNFKVKNNVGFQAGLAYKIKVIPNIVLQPELLYVQKNATCQEKGNASNSEKLNLHYLQVPVALQFGLNMVWIRPYFQVVPYLAYNLGDNISNKSFKVDDINKLNGGIGVGGGVDLWNMQLSIRYNWDFNKMGEENASDAPLYKQYKVSKGRALEISLALFF